MKRATKRSSNFMGRFSNVDIRPSPLQLARIGTKGGDWPVMLTETNVCIIYTAPLYACTGYIWRASPDSIHHCLG